MRAVLLIDEEMFRADDPHFTKHRPDPGYDSEFHVAAALRRLGYEAVAVPAVENLVQIVSSIKDMKPDVVFNLVEHIGGNRSNDSAAAAMLEVEKIPFTGATARALTISRDKHLSKLIVSAAGVAVPKSVVINGRSLRERDWSAFPAIVKPLDQDGSDGIEARSYVESGTQLRRQVRRATEEFSRRVICEEYIAGREFIVTVSGIDRVSID